MSAVTSFLQMMGNTHWYALACTAGPPHHPGLLAVGFHRPPGSHAICGPAAGGIAAVHSRARGKATSKAASRGGACLSKCPRVFWGWGAPLAREQLHPMNVRPGNPPAPAAILAQMPVAVPGELEAETRAAALRPTEDHTPRVRWHAKLCANPQGAPLVNISCSMPNACLLRLFQPGFARQQQWALDHPHVPLRHATSALLKVAEEHGPAAAAALPDVRWAAPPAPASAEEQPPPPAAPKPEVELSLHDAARAGMPLAPAVPEPPRPPAVVMEQQEPAAAQHTPPVEKVVPQRWAEAQPSPSPPGIAEAAAGLPPPPAPLPPSGEELATGLAGGPEVRPAAPAPAAKGPAAEPFAGEAGRMELQAGVGQHAMAAAEIQPTAVPAAGVPTPAPTAAALPAPAMQVRALQCSFFFQQFTCLTYACHLFHSPRIQGSKDSSHGARLSCCQLIEAHVHATNRLCKLSLRLNACR